MALNEPYGNTPLTTDSLASLGRPLRTSDFNQDAQGRYWRVIRGQKTYYAPEWFDQSGNYVGTDTDAAKAKTGTGESFFKQGQKYNWTTGEWENPTNWANVIGTVAAGGVGAGIAAPFVAGALGGASGAGSGVTALGDVGTELGAGAAGTGELASTTLVPLAGSLPAGGAGGAAGIAATLAEPGLASYGIGVPTATALTPGGTTGQAAITSTLASPSSPGFFSWPGTGSLVKSATGGGGVTSIWDLIVPGVNAGLNLYGQNQQANAIAQAGSQQLESTKYATDAQSKAAADQLAFLRGQAGYDAQTAEVNRQANYEQWKAKQEQLGTVGQALGLPARRIPDYVPLPANNIYNTGGGAPAGGAAPDPNAPVPAIQGGDIRSQVANYFQSRGVTPNPTSVDYWAQKWNEFGAKDPAYFNQRLAQADEFAGSGGPLPTVGAPPAPPAATPPANRYLPLTVDPALYASVPTTGQLRPYAANVGAYL